MTILDAFKLDGNVAPITSAAHGSGRGIALGLAEAGADYPPRRVASVEETLGEGTALGRRGYAVEFDLRGAKAKLAAEIVGEPSVVLDGADLDEAASTIAYAAVGYAGQKRTAASRVIAEDAIYEDPRDRLVAAMEAMEVFDPQREATKVGPLIEEDPLTFGLESSNPRSRASPPATSSVRKPKRS
jgi:NAD(P)-dependent dehydrogenase (short-subunit alcohol dehydrogenase family)